MRSRDQRIRERHHVHKIFKQHSRHFPEPREPVDWVKFELGNVARRHQVTVVLYSHGPYSNEAEHVRHFRAVMVTDQGTSDVDVGSNDD